MHRHTSGACALGRVRTRVCAHSGVCALVTLSRMNELALQSSTRATLAPRISLDVPTSGAPEHSTPRKLACALPFYVDNPDASARANWWVRCVAQAYIGRVCTRVSAHSGVCALGRLRTHSFLSPNGKTSSHALSMCHFKKLIE